MATTNRINPMRFTRQSESDMIDTLLVKIKIVERQIPLSMLRNFRPNKDRPLSSLEDRLAELEIVLSQSSGKRVQDIQKDTNREVRLRQVIGSEAGEWSPRFIDGVWCNTKEDGTREVVKTAKKLLNELTKDPKQGIGSLPKNF